MSTWMTALGLSLANWLLDVASLVLVFLATGGPVPLGGVLLAFAGSKVISSIGITPGRAGDRRRGLVGVLVAYGTAGSTAVAAVAVYRALTFVGLGGLGWLAVGILAIDTRRRPGRRTAPTQA